MRVEDKTYSLIQNTSEQRRKAPCVAMARSSAEMCHGLERSKFANKKQQDIFKVEGALWLDHPFLVTTEEQWRARAGPASCIHPLSPSQCVQ